MKILASSEQNLSIASKASWRGGLGAHTGSLTLIFLFFFVSGACGLLYQVVWTRKLVLLFGTTAYAVSAVLSIFFLGLGLGSLWGGRLADRRGDLLRLYGLFELLIGAWAVLFILLVDAGEGLIAGVLRAVGGPWGAGIALRAALAATLLIVPVTLMGATLPLLAKFTARRNEALGLPVGMLYSLNTLGAVAGCATTGFILLARFGYTRTTLIGAALNTAVGLVALYLAARYSERTEIRPGTTPSEKPVGASPPGLPPPVVAFVILAFAVSGFCSLALEVLWTRLLTVVFLGTTYAFTTMLTTVLCGIALGSAVAALFIDRLERRVAAFGIAQALTGLACLFMLFLFPDLPGWLQTKQVDVGFDWDRLVFWKFAYSFAVLFPPTFLFGMSFPLAVRALATVRANLGGAVGRLYGANTFGGVLGAATGGFLIIPALGTHWGIVALSLVMCAMGAALVLACPASGRGRKLTAVVGATVLLILAAVVLPQDVSRSVNRWYVPADHEVIHFSEGVEGTVSVTAPMHARTETDRVLWINAVQATASIEKGVRMNRFQGALPLLFDREPKRALFMCFGSGITAGTLALGPFERIDAVEISREVLEAAPLFAADNFNVLENPRVNYIIDDGRNYLLTTREKYDLITFEPMPLALAGVSTFYTKEYYELCRARLSEGGLVSQWVPLHSLNDEVVRGLVATFIAVFPESTAWFVNADLFLIGSDAPLRLDYAGAGARILGNDRLREALADANLPDLPELYAGFFMGKENLRKYAGDAPLMTDDRPWAEFVAPKLIYERTVQETLAVLQPLRESPLPLFIARTDALAAVERRSAAHLNDLEGLKSYYGGGVGSAPEEDFRKSLEIDPNDYNARYYLTEILVARAQLHVRWAEPEKALELAGEAKRHSPNRRDVFLVLGDAYHELGQQDEAGDAYLRYLELGGAEPRALDRAARNRPR